MTKKISPAMAFILIIGVVVIFIFMSNLQGWRWWEWKSEMFITEECQSLEDDPCALFACMAPGCWCEKRSTFGPIVHYGNKEVDSEKLAELIVKQYLNLISSDYDVEKAVKINSFFFNVLTKNVINTEKNFTVSADGNILETVCGA